MHMFTLTLVYCEMVLHVVGTRRLQGFRRIPLSGPLQTLGPTQTLHPDLSPIKCGSICTWNSSCSGFSYQAGLDASGIGSQCWTGHFHPFYIPQSGDTEHNHPFWVAHYPEEVGIPIGYEVGSDGNWYFRSTHRVTRTVAKTICESAPGGQLATPETEAETVAMVEYKSDQKTWIGLDYPSGVDYSITQENTTGVVFHLDGSPFIHEPFIPKFHLTVGTCFVLVTTGFVKFARSEACTNEYSYLCQIRVVPP